MDFSFSDRQEDQRSLADNVTLPAGDDPLDERNRALRVVICAAARGDTKAFEKLYHSTAGWMLSRVRRITGDAHAEDVLAQVYLQVWLSLPSFDASRGQPLAWLATIGRSRALDQLRTERRAHGGQLEAPSGEPLEESDDLDPEELLAIAQRSNLLKLSMGTLSCKEQLVLRLAYFRDCSQSEISVLTGMPLGTVKTLMTRSQQKLRVAMAAGGKGNAVHNASLECMNSP